MSAAMNLIIARGFPEMGTAALDGYNNQRQANEVSRSNNINANNAEQDQQFQVEDRARQMQQQMASQGQEAEVQALYQAASELSQMDHNDPKVQKALLAIGTRLESFRAGSGSGLMGMLNPKPAAAQSSLGKLGADLQAGRITQGDYDAASRKATYIAPAGGGVPQSEPLVAVQTPEGPQLMPRSQAAGMAPAEKPRAPVASLSAKELATARAKVMQAKTARAQLAKARQAFNALKNSVAAGPFGAGKIPTEGGKKFDAAVDSARNTVTAIFRVPGIGAMSDFETRLQQAAFPDRNAYESVTEQKLNDLDSMIEQLESGYQEMIGQPQENSGPKVGTVEGGFRFKGGDPADAANWVKTR